jgi:hypothetical protein
MRPRALLGGRERRWRCFLDTSHYILPLAPSGAVVGQQWLQPIGGEAMRVFSALWEAPDLSMEVRVWFRYSWTSKGLLVQYPAFTDRYLIRDGEEREIPGLFGGSGIFVKVNAGRAVVRYRPCSSQWKDRLWFIGSIHRPGKAFKGVMGV